MVRLLALAALLGAAAGGGLYHWAHRALVPGTQGLEVTIAPGSSVRGIGSQFEASGVPLDPLLLMMLARFEGRATRLQAGTYAVDGRTTPESLLDRMERGDVVRVALVIPEGWTFAQMRTLIADQADIRQTVNQMSDNQLMAAIGAPEGPPEGLFFPDTYVFAKGTTDVEIFKRAYRALQKRLADAWAARASDLPFSTPYDALILASIVEKETGRAEDRPLIAAVFINRIRRGMLLQTDPTVIYGLGARFDGNLRKGDLVANTPFNTYVHPGLPPTPIALVGAAALAAALNPARSDALYFVARGDGTSEFSGSLIEHNRAVERYQKAGAPRPVSSRR